MIPKTIRDHKVASAFLCLLVALGLNLLAWAVQGCFLGGKPDADYAQTVEYKIWREAFPLALSAIGAALFLSSIALWSWAAWSALANSVKERSANGREP